MNSIRYICLFFILLTTWCSALSQHILLEGNYDSHRIIISADCIDGECDGFYHTLYKTVCLEGSTKNNMLTLTGEKGRWDNSNELVMLMREKGEGGWEVEIIRDGNTETMKAVEVDLQVLKHRYEYLPLVLDMKRTDPFQYLVSMYIDYGKGIQGESFDFTVLNDSVKHIIEDILMNEMMNSLQPTCYGSYEYEVQNVETCKNILRFEISAGWDGGAHPDFGVTMYQVNLDENKKIEVEDVIDINKPEFDIEEILKATPGAMEAIEAASRESGGDCNYAGYSPGLSGVSCDGICVGYYFERVIRFCDDHCLIIIPFQVLKELGLLKSEFLYLAE